MTTKAKVRVSHQVDSFQAVAKTAEQALSALDSPPDLLIVFTTKDR